ncbi:hypothetical protein [Aureimonas populi]|uniref:Uncharacterized protein n=1 Tax=Aureimonas populi TaxID=1701758 RepID=A0ABW5CQN0_9HYPH|nr:hypothetical protein [Aureimonas populi]
MRQAIAALGVLTARPSAFSGLPLVIVARGLQLRLALARIVAIALLLAGALFSLVKGLYWEEALVLTAIAALLGAYGPAIASETGAPSGRRRVGSL